MIIDSTENFQKQSTSQSTTNPDKGKARADQSIPHVSNIFSQTHTVTPTTQEVFIPRDLLPHNKDDKEILESIKKVFLNNPHVIKFHIGCTHSYTKFVLTLNSSELFTELTTKPINSLWQSTAYAFTQSNLDRLILNRFKQQDDNVITLWTSLLTMMLAYWLNGSLQPWEKHLLLQRNQKAS